MKTTMPNTPTWEDAFDEKFAPIPAKYRHYIKPFISKLIIEAKEERTHEIIDCLFPDGIADKTIDMSAYGWIILTLNRFLTKE